jgi:hypothetical protein
MHTQMIWVRVSLLIVAIGEDHLRAFTANDFDKASNGFIEIGICESFWTSIRFGIGHSRIAVPKKDDFVIANERRSDFEFTLSDCREIGPNFGAIHHWIENVSLFAAGACHEHSSNTFGLIFRNGRSTLRGFVVGVGVD